MAKEIELIVKQNFTDKETNVDYKKERHINFQRKELKNY